MRSMVKRIAGVAAALTLAVTTTVGAASAAPTFDPSDCGGLYSLSRSGSTVRIIALCSDVRAIWGSGRYGTTEVWVSATGGTPRLYKGGFNTSSTGGANFTVSSSNKWWLLALVDNTGHEWCSGLYYK
jgi:hypothetical protein